MINIKLVYFLKENAKRQAEKRYHETLERAGISEDFIKTRGKGAIEPMDDDDPDTFSPSAHHSARSYTSGRSHTSGQSHSKTAGTGKYSEDFEGGSRHTDDEGSDIEEDFDEG